MHSISKIFAVVCSLALTYQSMEACTAFQLKSGDGANIYCRSMEYGFNLKSELLIVPQGSDYVGTAPNNQTGIKWKAKFGFVGLNQWISPTFVSDGMNEKGLVVGVLYLPGFAEYEKPDLKRTDKTLAAWELAAYLLGTCATLDDVRSAVKSVLVAQQPLPGTNFSLPLHYYVADNNGKVLIIEYVNGVRHEYDNSIGTLTNSPPFDWHINNLSNFVNLSPVNVAEVNLSGNKIQQIGQGSGLLGIPGDYTPPSRFVRAALYSQWAIPSKDAFETVRLGFHVLNTFDIFDGIIRVPKSDKEAVKLPNSTLGNDLKNELKDSEYTQWTVVHDRNNLKTYFRSYDSLQIQTVDLKKIDFTKPGFRKIDVQQDFIVDDVTAKAQPMKLQA